MLPVKSNFLHIHSTRHAAFKKLFTRQHNNMALTWSGSFRCSSNILILFFRKVLSTYAVYIKKTNTHYMN